MGGITSRRVRSVSPVSTYLELDLTAWFIGTHVFYYLAIQDFGDYRIKLGWHWMISILRATYHNVSIIHPSCSVWPFFFFFRFIFIFECFGLRCVSGFGLWRSTSFFPKTFTLVLVRDSKSFCPAQLPGTLA